MSVHDNKLAFCLMWYACGCGHQERVWNSRDGVTPSCIVCSTCGNLAAHVNTMDEYDPKYKLNHGQKFFRDGTEAEALTLAMRRLKNEPFTTARNGPGHDRCS